MRIIPPPGARVQTAQASQTDQAAQTGATGWPRPPACLRADQIDLPPQGARITVAGLVILRQRPGTAKGVIFITLEDEAGVVNIIVWRKIYETFRRAVIAGRLLRVTGRLQREAGVAHVIAERIEDISPLLDTLLAEVPPNTPDAPDMTDPPRPDARRPDARPDARPDRPRPADAKQRQAFDRIARNRTTRPSHATTGD